MPHEALWWREALAFAITSLCNKLPRFALLWPSFLLLRESGIKVYWISIIFANWTFPGLFFFIFLFNTTVDSNLKWPMIRLERKIFEFEGTPPTTVPQPLNALREFFA